MTPPRLKASKSALNSLFYGDNLDVLRRHIKSESVDLVYLDPPFNSNQDYNILFKEQDGTRAAAQIKAFGDTWRWDRGSAEAYEEVMQQGGRVADALRAFRIFLGESDMLAYLAMMAPRLKELHRVMKPNASIFLHCDPTASHYLKIIMDGVFGPKAYRNEIVWKRTPFSGSSKARAKQFPRCHDVIFFYAKGEERTWNPPSNPYSEKYLRRFNKDDLDGRGPYQSVLLKTYSEETLERLKADNRIIPPKRKGANWRYKQYLRESKQIRQIDDIWTDINAINPMAQERLGYPTQKPESLLERIVLACSNEGDLVLDPFCGCGTAVAVAHRFKRRWVGIDITHIALSLIKHRLASAFGDGAAFTTTGEPVSLPDARALSLQDRYQFELWALGLVGARPSDTEKKKKGADHGIDGRLYFSIDGRSDDQVIFSVKSGNVSVKEVRDLRGVIDRERAAIGVMITLQEPTKPMSAEAASGGFFKSPWAAHPRLQIITIRELLAGKQISMPPRRQVDTTFKKSPRARRPGYKAGTLFG